MSPCGALQAHAACMPLLHACVPKNLGNMWIWGWGGKRGAHLGGSETCNRIAEPPRRSSAFATLWRDEAGFPGGDTCTLVIPRVYTRGSTKESTPLKAGYKARSHGCHCNEPCHMKGCVTHAPAHAPQSGAYVGTRPQGAQDVEPFQWRLKVSPARKRWG